MLCVLKTCVFYLDIGTNSLRTYWTHRYFNPSSKSSRANFILVRPFLFASLLWSSPHILPQPNEYVRSRNAKLSLSHPGDETLILLRLVAAEAASLGLGKKVLSAPAPCPKKRKKAARRRRRMEAIRTEPHWRKRRICIWRKYNSWLSSQRGEWGKKPFVMS